MTGTETRIISVGSSAKHEEHFQFFKGGLPLKSVVSEKAYSDFSSGFNCAESVFRSILEYVDGSGQPCYKLATPFGGGLGGSRQELCGALAGGVMAIGHLTGRDHSEEDATLSKVIAAKLRDRFISHLGCTQCQAILDRLGPQDNSQQCAYLVAQTAGWLTEILAGHQLLSLKESTHEQET